MLESSGVLSFSQSSALARGAYRDEGPNQRAIKLVTKCNELRSSYKLDDSVVCDSAKSYSLKTLYAMLEKAELVLTGLNKLSSAFRETSYALRKKDMEYSILASDTKEWWKFLEAARESDLLQYKVHNGYEEAAKNLKELSTRYWARIAEPETCQTTVETPAVTP